MSQSPEQTHHYMNKLVQILSKTEKADPLPEKTLQPRKRSNFNSSIIEFDLPDQDSFEEPEEPEKSEELEKSEKPEKPAPSNDLMTIIQSYTQKLTGKKCLHCSGGLPKGSVDPFCESNPNCKKLCDLHFLLHAVLRSPTLGKQCRLPPTDKNIRVLIVGLNLTLQGKDGYRVISTNVVSSHVEPILEWQLPPGWTQTVPTARVRWNTFYDCKCNFCKDPLPLNLISLERLVKLIKHPKL